jgi:hypothetical protein
MQECLRRGGRPEAVARGGHSKPWRRAGSIVSTCGTCGICALRVRRTSCGSWCTCAAIVTNIQLSAECFAYRGCARRSNPCWGAGDGPCGALAQARAGEGPCGGAVAPRAVLKPAPWPPTPGYRRPGNATTLSKRLQEPAASYSELLNACRLIIAVGSVRDLLDQVHPPQLRMPARRPLGGKVYGQPGAPATSAPRSIRRGPGPEDQGHLSGKRFLMSLEVYLFRHTFYIKTNNYRYTNNLCHRLTFVYICWITVESLLNHFWITVGSLLNHLCNTITLGSCLDRLLIIV